MNSSIVSFNDVILENATKTYWCRFIIWIICVSIADWFDAEFKRICIIATVQNFLLFLFRLYFPLFSRFHRLWDKEPFNFISFSNWEYRNYPWLPWSCHVKLKSLSLVNTLKHNVKMHFFEIILGWRKLFYTVTVQGYLREKCCKYMLLQSIYDNGCDDDQHCQFLKKLRFS